jgi:hypothetical protein
MGSVLVSWFFYFAKFVTFLLDLFVASANLTKMQGKTYFLKETSHQGTKNSRGQSAD